MKPKCLGIALVVCSALLATPAGAQGLGLGGTSSQSSAGGGYYPVWGMELRIFSYNPILTNYSEAIAVRDKIYSSNRSFFAKNPVGASLEANWYPFTAFGLAGGYARAGFWTGSANTRQCKDGDKIIPCTPQTILKSDVGDDSQSLKIVPISVGLLYRFDLLRRSLGWPVVATAKLGLDYNVWWASLGVGNAHTPSGARAIGGILGYSGSVSVGYAFDAGGKNAAGLTYASRRDTQETYLFVEWSFVNGRALFLPDTKAQPRVDLSDAAVISIGMALEFN